MADTAYRNELHVVLVLGLIERFKPFDKEIAQAVKRFAQSPHLDPAVRKAVLSISLSREPRQAIRRLLDKVHVAAHHYRTSPQPRDALGRFVRRPALAKEVRHVRHG